MENNERYYTRSNGEKISLSSMNTEHVINGLAKRYREIFNATDKDDFSKRLEEINDIKEEMYKRINDFNEKLEG